MSKWEEVQYYPDQRTQMALKKTYKFANFVDALDFTNKVGQLAEQANHHPDINLGWGYVQIWLTTHSEGSITGKDRKLAQQIDKLSV